jgi:hypothetical protein
MTTPRIDDSEEWNARAARLARIVSHGEIGADCPLVKAVRLPPAAFARLQGAVGAYLWHSLCCGFSGQVFALDQNLIIDHAEAVLGLPNRTPNGVLLPRRETFHSFNLIHQALAAALDALGLIDCFSLIQIPCNVRIVGGANDPGVDQRRYSSAKIHTDVWNGEPMSSILFNIPVLGDTQAVDLVFYEPKVFNPSLRVPLGDYALGDAVTAEARRYPMSFDLGLVYVSDALSLHQTIKRRPNLRVSLDFRGIARELLPGESAAHPHSRAVYVAPELWRASGSTIVLGSGEPLDGFQRRQAGEKVGRAPPTIFDIDDMPSE